MISKEAYIIAAMLVSVETGTGIDKEAIVGALIAKPLVFTFKKALPFLLKKFTPKVGTSASVIARNAAMGTLHKLPRWGAAGWVINKLLPSGPTAAELEKYKKDGQTWFQNNPYKSAALAAAATGVGLWSANELLS